MARTITISLPDSLGTRLEAVARARGSRSLDDCALAILTEVLARMPRMPEDRERLEAELRKGLAGRTVELTEEDWARMEAELGARHTRPRAR